VQFDSYGGIDVLEVRDVPARSGSQWGFGQVEGSRYQSSEAVIRWRVAPLISSDVSVWSGQRLWREW
jgi:hypothetical protein